MGGGLVGEQARDRVGMAGVGGDRAEWCFLRFDEEAVAAISFWIVTRSFRRPLMKWVASFGGRRVS